MLYIMHGFKPESFDRQLRDAFKELYLLSSVELDKDNTAFVSIMELRHILTSIGEKLEPVKWIKEVDVGCDPLLLTPI